MASPNKKATLIRIDPTVHDAVQRWANDDMRSFNAQVEYLLKEALKKAGRKPAAPRQSQSPPSGSSHD